MQYSITKLTFNILLTYQTIRIPSLEHGDGHLQIVQQYNKNACKVKHQISNYNKDIKPGNQKN